MTCDAATLVPSYTYPSITHACASPTGQDPWLHEVENWGYQALQPHQDAAIRAAEEHGLATLVDKLKQQQQQDQASSSKE